MHFGARRRAAGRESGLRVALAGTMLIASAYGMARFGVGLFAPRLVLERPALIRVVGFAAAAQFVSYAMAAAVAARLVHRRPRTGLVLAGLTSTAGCVGVAAFSTPLAFLAAVFVGGMGAGFASPAMVRVVDCAVSGRAAPTAQSMVNAGTSVGVIAVGGLAFATTSTAGLWVLMALACAASAGAVLFVARSGSVTFAATEVETSPASASGQWGRLLVPVLAALVVGAGSALIWTFGPLLATEAGLVDVGQVGWLWIALGMGGLVGPLTGVVVGRLGPRGGWRLFAGVLALGNVALAVAMELGVSWGAFAAMAMFGGGYMCLSGVLILWARAAWPTAAGAGTSILFIALAVGQALGSAGFELARSMAGPIGMVLSAAALCAIGGGLSRLRALRHEAATGATAVEP